MAQRSVRSGQQAVGEDKLSQIGNYQTSQLFTEREKVALEYADAITCDPTSADDVLWAKLHEHFTEPELVEIGYAVGVFAGGQRWIHTLQVQHGELRVIPPAARIADVASGAMRREAAVSDMLVGAQRIWLGYVELGPGLVSAVHHHGEAESGIYIISGQARFYSGERLDRVVGAHAGDFVWVPPQLVHVEQNVSPNEPVRMAVARSTQANLTFNLPTPEHWSPEPSGT